MNPIKYIKALVGIDDVRVFWQLRDEILLNNGGVLIKFLCKVIRKHYGAGIPISRSINKFITPHGFYGIFISEQAIIGCNCVIFQQVTIGLNNFKESKNY